MPIWDFQCNKCNKIEARYEKTTRDKKCSFCDGKAKRIFTTSTGGGDGSSGANNGYWDTAMGVGVEQIPDEMKRHPDWKFHGGTGDLWVENPKDQKKKSMLPLLIVLAIGLILGAVGAGYYNRFGFSFPFINDIMEKGQDNTPEKAGLIATPMAQERLLELNRAEIPNGDTEADRVGESEEFIAAEMSQYPTDPQSTAVQEKNLTYHLVAGSFTVEQNAHDLHGELIAKGYESVFLGKIGAYYKVSYQSFNNEDDANNALQALKGKDVSSWMIQYKLE